MLDVVDEVRSIVVLTSAVLVVFEKRGVFFGGEEHDINCDGDERTIKELWFLFKEDRGGVRGLSTHPPTA